MSDLKAKCMQQSKPFSSLTYLAKSTIAVTGSLAAAGNGACPASPRAAATAPQMQSPGAGLYNHLGTKANGYRCPRENGDCGSLSETAEEPRNAERVDRTARSCPWGLAKQMRAAALATEASLRSDSNSDFASLSNFNSLDNWDYTIELECLQGPQDLQLAAELGKTLLERNKELELLLKEHKNTVEEQEQEIVYLKKHTTALREVNDSRLKVYEQLEVGIQDLERANHRLIVENTSDKKHIKTLTHNIESLESRCDELGKQLEESRHALAMERRKNERLLQERNNAANEGNVVRLRPVERPKLSPERERTAAEGYDANTSAPENCSFAFLSPGHHSKANSTGVSGCFDNVDGAAAEASEVGSREDNEDILLLVTDLETTRKAFMTEQQRCGELEEQLVAIIQENQTLQGRIAQSHINEEMKSVHDELSILDEVRQGQMCCRCLRAVDDRNTINDEQSSIAPTEEEEEEDDDEERSLLDLDAVGGDGGANGSEHSQAGYRSNVSIQVASSRGPDAAPASPNPYRELVEKYEALLEVQRSSVLRQSGGGPSLAAEFQSAADFNETQKLMLQAAAAVESSSSSCNGSTANAGDSATIATLSSNKSRGRTPTEFSEAETSSSGFADETSNKSTQTEERPGYFLCSIGDGEDCKFSIYDDASPIDSRFRNRPEYRELFKEIFAVLKKAAENKEEGDKLPLLDDAHPSGAKVPPVTPANEEQPPLPDYGADDAQSVVSSAVSEQSFAMSECITKLERRTAKKHIIEKNQENRPPTTGPIGASAAQLATPTAPAAAAAMMDNGRILTPLKREPLEYLTVGAGIKKKNRKKNRNFSNERAESPVALPSPPRFFVMSGKKRKDLRPFVPNTPTTPEQPPGRRGSAKFEWNGSSMVIYNRSMNTPPQPASTPRRRGSEAATPMEYRPSTVSQELHKLKKLDLSYAEVLRRADVCKHSQQHQRRRHH